VSHVLWQALHRLRVALDSPSLLLQPLGARDTHVLEWHSPVPRTPNARQWQRMRPDDLVAFAHGPAKTSAQRLADVLQAQTAAAPSTGPAPTEGHLVVHPGAGLRWAKDGPHRLHLAEIEALPGDLPPAFSGWSEADTAWLRGRGDDVLDLRTAHGRAAAAARLGQDLLDLLRARKDARIARRRGVGAAAAVICDADGHETLLAVVST